MGWLLEKAFSFFDKFFAYPICIESSRQLPLPEFSTASSDIERRHFLVRWPGIILFGCSHSSITLCSLVACFSTSDDVPGADFAAACFEAALDVVDGSFDDEEGLSFSDNRGSYACLFDRPCVMSPPRNDTLCENQKTR